MSLPVARDPRMDRAEPSPEPYWTLMIVPSSGARSSEVRIFRHHLVWTRTAVIAAMIAGVVLLAVVGVMFPRNQAYSGLVEENLELKLRLQQIDTQMTEVNRILLRLRLYDAEWKSLATPEGDHGPIDDGTWANEAFVAEGHPMEFDDGSGEEIQGVAEWGDSVLARTELFMKEFSVTEANLNTLLGDLSDWRAIDQALPSTWPTKGMLSSGFGWRRDPFGRRLKFHSGLDISNDRGTPIRAAADGVVARAEWSNGYGQMVVIDHGFGVSTLYGHCAVLKVTPGQKVSAGDLVARMGSTGRSTGPHLHFEIRLDGHPVDPMDYMPRRRALE